MRKEFQDAVNLDDLTKPAPKDIPPNPLEAKPVEEEIIVASEVIADESDEPDATEVGEKSAVLPEAEQDKIPDDKTAN